MNNIISKGITILGSTGTIGVNTLDVISRHSNLYHVIALSANSNVDKMLEQCRQYHPQYAVMVDEQAADQLSIALKNDDIEVLSGAKSLAFIAKLEQVDYVMAAIVGAAGLLPNLAAAKAGKRVLLAYKESLVMSGKLFMDALHENNATLLPIDSEHNAIFQCLPVSGQQGVTKILLTASGGPFRTRNIETLHDITPEQAVAHPNWVMGRKISVDSATMMNKGLEVIEAHYLFNMSADDIEVIIHPQSIIHSSIYFKDGSTISQLGNPTMQTPIAYGMAYPDRICAGVEPLDLTKCKLEFFTPDYDKFPNLKLAYYALRAGAEFMGALNAANEVAVEGFLKGQIGFLDISKIVEKTLEKTQKTKLNNLSDIVENDKLARVLANNIITKL